MRPAGTGVWLSTASGEVPTDAQLIVLPAAPDMSTNLGQPACVFLTRFPVLHGSCRDIQRQASTWFCRKDPAMAQSRLEALQRWTTACIFSLKHHLRPGGSLKDDLEGILPAYELEALLNAEHRPLYALQVCSELNRVGGACPELQTRIDRNFTIMEDVIGACEKILRTPIPVNYTRHTSRFLVSCCRALSSRVDKRRLMVQCTVMPEGLNTLLCLLAPCC